MRKLFYLFISVIVLYSCDSVSEFELQSPDGLSCSLLNIEDDNLSFNLIYHGDTIVRSAEIFLASENDTLLRNISLAKVGKSLVDENWNAVNGKNKHVRNNYCLYQLDIQNKLGQNVQMEVRVYNQGFAYRFIVPEGDGRLTENSTIGFGDDFTFWAYNGEKHNVGPVKLTEYGENSVLNPVVFCTSSENYFALHEAEITEYSPFTLKNAGANSFVLNQECAGKKRLSKNFMESLFARQSSGRFN